MTINALIERLTEMRNSVGGNTPVVFSFNGCVESGTFLNISEVLEEPYFLSNGEEFCLVRYYNLEKGENLKPMVHLFSNRDHFQP